jgi:hypothetical protein
VTNSGAVKLIDFGAAVDMCTGINFNPSAGMLDPRQVQNLSSEIRSRAFIAAVLSQQVLTICSKRTVGIPAEVLHYRMYSLAWPWDAVPTMPPCVRTRTCQRYYLRLHLTFGFGGVRNTGTARQRI